MTEEKLQQDALLQQLQRKQALKQQCLRQTESSQPDPVTMLFYKNAVLLATQRRADLFSLLRQLRYAAPEGNSPLDSGISAIRLVAELLSVEPCTLLLEDKPQTEYLVSQLLRDLDGCDAWQDVTTTPSASSFTLPGFDYALRMTETPHATLLFSMTQSGFALEVLGSDLPGTVPLWQEQSGLLQEFMETVFVTYAEGEEHRKIKAELTRHAQTMKDLAAAAREQPDAFRLDAFLQKEALQLTELRDTLRDQLTQHPDDRDAVLLLSGAAGQLHSGTVDALQEAAYLVQGAADTITSSPRRVAP